MGCNNSHLRPFFRRCRRRRSKKDDSSVTPKGDYIEIERNGSGGDGDLSHGIQLLGASIRNANNKTADSTADSTFCVPLLAQAEASSSQIDFFKMLDEKIEQGPDYDSDEDENHFNPSPSNQKKSVPAYSIGRRKSAEPPSSQPPLNNTSKFSSYSWDEEGD